MLDRLAARRRSRHLVAPPLVWIGLAALVLAAGAVLVSIHASSQARRTVESADAFRRWLGLFRIERDMVYAAERMETAALYFLTTGSGEEELARTQAAFTRQLASTERALERFLESSPRDNGTAQRLLWKVRDFRRSHEPPLSSASTLHAVYALYYGSAWVPLTAPEGEWFELCTFVYDLQSVTYYPIQTLDEYLARYWEEILPPTEPEARAHIESVIAWLRAVEIFPHDSEAVRWEVDPLLRVDRARQFGPELTELVEDLLAQPEAQVIRDTAPFLIHGEREPDLQPEEMFERMTHYGDVLMAGAERALRLADAQIVLHARSARRQSTIARSVALLVAAVAAAVLLGVEIRRRRFNGHLLTLAQTDTLTGVGNRLMLQSREPSRLADPRQGGFALIQLDLDNFKAINDSFGHAAGDQALIVFASHCRRLVRAEDTLARVGGDEFVIVLHGLADPERSASEIARRLQGSLIEPIDFGGRAIRLQASVGIATAAGPASLDELMVEADLALYAAKEGGRDRHQVFADSARRLLVRDLPQVLAERRLDCAFQPQVDLETGEVVGVEALARWPDPGAAVPAGKMIDVIEWLGLTTALLRCIMARVQGAHFRTRDRLEGRFWVNLSPLDLTLPDAGDRLLEILGSSSVPLDRLGIEITESLPIVDFERAEAVLSQLRACGLAVAIDDFGSQNTPLRYLTRLPIDVVKLDRSVVSRIDSERSNLILADAVRAIGEAHGMIVLAEGVETEREMAVLREIGVPRAQGYAIARPLGLDDLVGFLDRVASAVPAPPPTDGRPLAIVTPLVDRRSSAVRRRA